MSQTSVAKKKLKPIEVNFKPTLKQAEAWHYLTSPEFAGVSEVLFGGGAGSGKSFFGCCWLIIMCLQYPGTRWLLGRSKLVDLKKTTLATFFDVLTSWGIPPQRYIYNQQDNIITFVNEKSEIYLKDLMTYPTDPNFDSLGSLELSGAFIDEANMISEKAKNVVSSRIRYKLEQYNLTPKLLITCNPAKNWVYDQFYKPWKFGSLPEFRKFVQALVQDNPHISKHYAEQLSKLDELSKRRLLYGEWELENENNLIDYDRIINLFNNTKYISSEKDQHFLSVDCARQGKDKSIIFVWHGFQVIDMIEFAVNDIPTLVNAIHQLKVKYNVSPKNIIIDSDGVGGGVADYVKDSVHFVNNQKALGGDNYQNLKTQCYYQLASLINADKISINLPKLSVEAKNNIIQELELIRAKNIDSDGKLQILSKDEIKLLIGRSPDYSDALMMRAWFNIPAANKFTGEYFIRSTSFKR